MYRQLQQSFLAAGAGIAVSSPVPREIKRMVQAGYLTRIHGDVYIATAKLHKPVKKAGLAVGDKVHVPVNDKWSSGSFEVLEVSGERCRIKYGPFISLRRVSALRLAA